MLKLKNKFWFYGILIIGGGILWYEYGKNINLFHIFVIIMLATLAEHSEASQ